MAILNIENVSYSYKSKYQVVNALKGINFEFESGKLYSIMGPSGSGKTTFLSLLAGLDIPTGGQVVFNGRATHDIDRDDYRFNHVSIIYQNFNLLQHLTVLENVEFPLLAKKIKKADAEKRAKEELFSVGLTEEKYKKFPNMLSGGEQQRVAIARALASQSEIILADEPTGNLDKANGKNIIEILQKLAHEKNCCVIIVTHDAEISRFVDVSIILEDGMIKE